MPPLRALRIEETQSSMTGKLRRAGGTLMLVLGMPAAAAAQDPSGDAPPAADSRFSIQAGAGFQTYYRGSSFSVAFGFAPTRSLTVLVAVERSHAADRIALYEDGYSAERGATEQFVSGEVRYAFLPTRRVSPYVVGGTGRGLSRPNVSERFPDRRQRHTQVLYYGGGVRMPIGPRFDAFVDARIIMAVEARSDYFAVHLPVRAGAAWRF